MAAAANTFALVVGIAEYDAGDAWRLHAPVVDAVRAVAWLLRRGVPASNISLFVSPAPPSLADLVAAVEPDPPSGIETVTPALGTEHAITEAIRQRIRKQPGDVLFVFWGGHGVVDHEREQRLFFADATDDDRRNLNVKATLESLRSDYVASFPTQIFCIDACASRLDTGLGAMTLPNTELTRGRDVNARKQMVLSAATRGQAALESVKQQTGLFTRELIAELDRDTSGQWPPDMHQVATRLKTRFRELHGKLSIEQMPAEWTYDGDEGIVNWKAPDGSSARQAPLRREAIRRVDRILQTRAFSRFFTDGVRTHRNRPHAVVLYGDEREAHASLVDRIVLDYVQKIARELLGLPAIPPARPLQWPTNELSLDDRREALRQDFASETDDTCRALLRDRAGEPLVVFHHNWVTSRWSDDDRELLRWYLDEYWKDLPSDAATPHVLLFVKLICGPELSRMSAGSLLRGFRTPLSRMRTDLEALEPDNGGACRRVVLDELAPVPFDLLKKWFLDETLGWLSEKRALDEAQRIFAGPGGRPLPSRPMADILDALDTLIESNAEQKAS